MYILYDVKAFYQILKGHLSRYHHYVGRNFVDSLAGKVRAQLLLIYDPRDTILLIRLLIILVILSDYVFP